MAGEVPQVPLGAKGQAAESGQALDGQLLNVTCNDYVLCTFLLHRESGAPASLTLLNAASLQRRPLALPDSLPAGSPLDFHFRFRTADSACIVRTGADSCRFDGILLNQRLNGKLPFYLHGAGVKCAHKTGEDDGITHDVGIIFADQPVIFSFLSENTDVPEAELALQKLALAAIEP